jgi:alpha,alpha-trehalose phosphorylase
MALADNNVYTNLMAQRNLNAAADAAVQHADRAQELGGSAREIASWRAAARSMLVPYDEQLGVNPQPEGFHPAPDVGLQGNQRGPVSADAAFPLL